jgi:hypothetical protein
MLDGTCAVTAVWIEIWAKDDEEAHLANQHLRILLSTLFATFCRRRWCQ